MQVVPSDPGQAILVGDFEGFSPLNLFESFTVPERVVVWWSERAQVDLEVGHSFEFSWPQQNWTLRWRYTAIEPGVHLGFTWNWDHEPDHPEQQVDLWFDSLDSGARMSVFQLPFALDEEGRTVRQGVLEGWIHFGMRLAGIAAHPD